MALRNTDGKYMTRNLYLAAYLHLLQYEMEVRREHNDRFSFWAEIDERLEGVVDAFYRNEANVEPIAYSVALKEIKTKMYA